MAEAGASQAPALAVCSPSTPAARKAARVKEAVAGDLRSALLQVMRIIDGYMFYSVHLLLVLFDYCYCEFIS